MSDHLEEMLRGTLGHASELAPRAPSTLSAHIMRRSRVRRMRAQALVAAAAVVVIAGGAAVAVRGAGHDPTAVTPTVTPSPTATEMRIPASVEEVWPEAVRKIPAKLPGGRKFQPRGFVDDHTLLLETWESFEKADAIYAYDLDSGRIRKITSIRTPKGVYASGYAVGGGRIVWQTIDVVHGKPVTSFWSAPVTGGKVTAIATERVVRGRGDRLAVVGDTLAFSLLEGGVFTVPLDGGAVEPVAGAAGHHILRWPWVGAPGEYTPEGETSFQELLNAETGETSRAVVHPGEEYVRCGVTTCSGTKADRTAFYRLRDGSQERPLPEKSSLFGLARDRFLTVRLPNPPGGQALYDVVTGKSGDLGLRPNAKGQSIAVEAGLGDGRLVAYPLGNEYVIIDLAKIR
ncbi:hypothetical protein [Microtetraspora niveoalba]|uniref:hypothetical protein n=1 Tax=Microtetraspora niveoalba TaxID=46175 RepID=UPI00082B4533|nr:hypothetical protein [Microtetraspora niveoalba]